jgi:uncharacterized protein YdaU (DUF1376 family)
MNKPPAFQLYASDFYMDTAGWTVAQVGAYTRLLMYEWINGGIPSDMASLARIAGISDVRTMYKMWRQTLVNKFISNGGNLLHNKRLELEREKQSKYRESQSQKGVSGATKRWKDHVPRAMPKLIPEDSSSSSTSSSIKKRRSNTVFQVPSLEEVKDYCVKRGNSIDAEAFIAHYNSNGWMVGKNKMKDWRATIVTWEKRNYGTNENRVRRDTRSVYDKEEDAMAERINREWREAQKSASVHTEDDAT